MQFDAILLPPRRADSIAPGYWHDRTINEDLDACLAECPDKLALTAVRVEAGDVRRFGITRIPVPFHFADNVTAPTDPALCGACLLASRTAARYRAIRLGTS